MKIDEFFSDRTPRFKLLSVTLFLQVTIQTSLKKIKITQPYINLFTFTTMVFSRASSKLVRFPLLRNRMFSATKVWDKCQALIPTQHNDVIVELGNSFDTLLKPLNEAKQEPSLKLICMDKSENIEIVHNRSYNTITTSAEDIQFIRGDALFEVPYANTYLLNHTLSQYANEQASAVLKTIFVTSAVSGKIIVIEDAHKPTPPAGPHVDANNSNSGSNNMNHHYYRSVRDLKLLFQRNGYEVIDEKYVNHELIVFTLQRQADVILQKDIHFVTGLAASHIGTTSVQTGTTHTHISLPLQFKLKCNIFNNETRRNYIYLTRTMPTN